MIIGFKGSFRVDEIEDTNSSSYVFPKHKDFKLYDFESYGFSYFQNKSQDTYYGVPITSGKKVPDIHGTLLCTWALIMALDINEKLNSKYKIIKP